MANISIDIPDQHIPRIVNAFAIEFNYETSKLNGETKAQFSKRMLIAYIKELVLRFEIRNESNDLYRNKKSDIDGIGFN